MHPKPQMEDFTVRPRLAATPPDQVRSRFLPFSLPSALQTRPSDFHRRSNAPCPAHTFELTGLGGFSRRSGGMIGCTI